jgi:hypothetical protein
MKCCRAESIDLETSHSPVVARRKRRATRDATHTTPARRRTRPRTNPRRMLPPLHTLVLYDQPQTVRRPRASLHRAENEHSFRSLRFASPRARVRPGRARVSSLRRRADASPPPSRRRSRRRRISGSQSGRTSRRRVHARRDSRARRARARAQFGTASSSRSLARRRRRAASLDGRGDDDSTIRRAAPRRPPLHRGAPRALSRAAPPARVSRAPSPIDR